MEPHSTSVDKINLRDTHFFTIGSQTSERYAGDF